MPGKVIVIGGGLTGLVTAFYLKKRGVDFLLLEKEDRVGGVINSFEEEGFIFESGPNTGVIGHPEVAELFEDLEGFCNLEIADEKAKKRLILKNGKWEAIPSSLIGGIKTPLFTWKDKFRILAEPFRKKGNNPHENLAEMVKRRMGQSFLDYAVDPFIKGVYAGDPEYLIPKYALPKLYRLEQEYGSFIGGSIRKSRKEKDPRQKKATREVFSTEGGLGKLVEGLGNAIGKEHIQLLCNDIQIIPSDGKYEVKFESGDKEISLIAEKVITTTGSYQLAQMISFIQKDLISKIDNLVYARVAEVALGFKKWEGIDIKAFGGLIPSKENRKILGILFPSSFLKNRAPAEGALLTCFLGGMANNDLPGLNDEQLFDLVRSEVQGLMGLPAFNPDIVRIFRYQRAIPQYGIKTGVRYEAIEEIERKFPGLYIAGNLRGGIGMADRIKQGREMAEKC